MVFEWIFGSTKTDEPEPSLSDKTLVVIGGGMAGLSAIYGMRQIDREIKIVLIEPKQYSEVLWASYRSPFVEWVRKGSLIDLSKYCNHYNIEHIQNVVTKITSNEVTLDDNNDKIQKFDVCCIAVGATSNWEAMGRGIPTTIEGRTIQNRLDVLEKEGKRILNATSVTIIGGGLIGCELAGDIAGYSSKQQGKQVDVTIVHSTSQLCPIMNEQASIKLTEQLQKLGVQIILEEKATTVLDNSKEEEEESTKKRKKKVQLQKSGKIIECDIVIETIGFKPLNKIVEEAFGSDTLDSKGWIQTDDYFRIPGKGVGGKVFAYGDCTSSTPNAANIYFRMANTLGHNMKCSLLTNNADGDNNNDDDNNNDNRSTSSTIKMIKYEIPFAGYCNTSGPDSGVFYSTKFWTSWFLPWMKNKTMFFSAPRDMIGVQKQFTL